MIPLYMPIMDQGERNVIGLVTIYFYETELETAYSYYENGTEHLMILDQQGCLVSAKSDEGIGAVFGNSQAFAKLIQNGEGSQVIEYNNTDVLFSCLQNSPNQFWIVSIGSCSKENTTKQSVNT